MPASSASGEGRRSPTAIVLIDDDQDLLNVLQHELRAAVPDDLPYQLLAASNPDEGLQRIHAIRTDQPLIVFCDFDLQAGTTGADLLVEVARVRPRALRVLTSGHSRAYLQSALDACRPDAFHEKSQDLRAFVAEMAHLIITAANRMAPRRTNDGPQSVVFAPAPSPSAPRAVPSTQVGPELLVGVPSEQDALAPLDATRVGRGPVDDRYFRLMADHLADYAAFLLDVEGRVVTWNPGAASIKGYTADEIIGEHFGIFYPQADIDARKPLYELRRAEVDGRFENTGWRLRKDGSRFWANVIITALRDEGGRLLGYAKIARDQTQHRHAEETLRDSEQRYRLMVENITDYGIVLLDVRGHVLSWSEGAYRSTGYTEDEVLGHHIAKFCADEAGGQEAAELDLERALRERGYEQEGWRPRRDGKRFWANVIVSPLFDPFGRHCGFTQIMRDLTARREAQEALRRAEELKAVMRELDEFNDAVAHELRGPVRALLGFAMLLTQENEDPKKRELFLTRIRTVAGGMTATIDDLLNLSRSSKSEVQRAVVDLSAIASQVADKSVGEGRAPPEAFRIAPGLVANGDPRLLQSVLENLIANAVKFSAGRDGIQIEVGEETIDGTHRFFVRDNGIGFDESHATGLFRPFVRLHQRGTYDGTGIGLATVHRIITRHGGRVWATSRAGEGATFSFTLAGA